MKKYEISYEVYKNTVTGELHISKNKITAWLYFYDKAKDSIERNMPTFADIIVIQDKNINNE